MTISAIALFGSRARGDGDQSSDVDLLLITSEEKPRHEAMGQLSLSFYPWADLLHRAGKGDLFVCHLALESKAIYDPDHQLRELQAALHLRESYADEVRAASDLGWSLVRLSGELPNPSLVNRRIAWCVRTILIARSAEAGRPMFSAAELTTFAHDNAVAQLIRQKEATNAPSTSTLDLLREFLTRWGNGDPLPVTAGTNDYRMLFLREGNDLAFKTLSGFGVESYAD